MATFNSAAARRLVFTLHQWVALILFLALVPLGISGSALMFPELLNKMGAQPPQVATVGGVPRTPSQLIQDVAGSVPPGGRVQTLRLPQASGQPAAVVVSTGRPGPGGSQLLWVNPVTGNVLKAAGTTSPAFRLAHDLHGQFLVRGVGRTLVGWGGVAMLLLSLTGIWLWWPRGAFLKGFRWRRTPDTLNNLHHFTGFWLSIPLAVVSVTGILISFPKVNAAVFGAGPPRAEGPRAPGGPGGRGPGGAPPRAPSLSPEQALAAAQAAHPGAQPTAITLPGAGGGRPGPVDPALRNAWRVELVEAGTPSTVLVDDVTGQVRAAPAPRRPNGPGSWVRPVHEGEGAGPIWRWLVFLTGFLPLLLAFTGVFLWARNELRRRQVRAA